MACYVTFCYDSYSRLASPTHIHWGPSSILLEAGNRTDHPVTSGEKYRPVSEIEPGPFCTGVDFITNVFDLLYLDVIKTDSEDPS